MSDLTQLEDIVMIGYPNGLWDSKNNMPIFRRGVTASHPRFDWNGRKEFLIDAACFPGSSGSPVLLYNEGSYPRKSGGIALGSRLYLLGILYAGPQHTVTGEIEIVPIQTIRKAVSIATIPNNLGMVIKSSELHVLDRKFAAMNQTL